MARLKQIMVVDDEAGIRALLFEALAEEGFKVTLAKDGKDSLKQMRNRRFDLLITDINMPHIDGIELLRKMKRAGRKEKVILMTGEPIDQSRLNKETQPVFVQLKKPFRMNKFLQVVSSALEPQRGKMPSSGTDRRTRRKRNAV